MKKYQSKDNIKLGIVSFFISIFFIIPIAKKNMFKKDMYLKLVLKISKDVNFQVFYTDKIEKFFNEQDSIRKKLYKANNYQEVQIKLENLDKLENMRIDLGENPGKIEIKKIQIIGKKNINIDLEDLLKFSTNDIENKIRTANSIQFFSEKVDPYIILDKNQVKNKQKMSFDFLLSTSLLITFFFVIFKILKYIERKKNIGWISSFYILVLFILFVFPILKIDNEKIDKKENRNLAEKPALLKDKKINLNYGKEIEKWLEDHFYKRRMIIDNYEKINQKIIRRVENDRAMVGENDWIFYKGDNSIVNFQNINLFTQQQLENIEANLIARKKWLENKGIKYYTFVAPDKNKIYGEFYPKYINKVSDKGRAHQLEKFLSIKNKTTIIYPYTELMDQKKNGVLYWKTDTHWNEHGAFIGYTKLMNEIKKDFSELEVLSEKDFNIETNSYPNGDLTGMLEISNTNYAEPIYKTFIQKNKVDFQYIKNEGIGGVITKSSKPLKVLVLRDSFTSAMIPYISETFGEVEYIWNHNFNSFQEKILAYNPDIIIHEMVERYINVLEINTPKLIGGI